MNDKADGGTVSALDGGGPAEGCGCVMPPRAPSPPSAETQAATVPDARSDVEASGPALLVADEPPGEPASPTSAAAGLKLVITLKPLPAGGHKALLSLGSEGCDPELRVCETPDLFAALAEVPALLTAARARWQSQPRYPTLGRLSAGARAPAMPRRPAVVPPFRQALLHQSRRQRRPAR